MNEFEPAPFQTNTLDEDKKRTKEEKITVKLNSKDKEMVEIGRYAFNKESKSGVLKDLAEIGLKVVLNDLGVEYLHKLTNPRRRFLIQEKPKYLYFDEK